MNSTVKAEEIVQLKEFMFWMETHPEQYKVFLRNLKTFIKDLSSIINEVEQ